MTPLLRDARPLTLDDLAAAADRILRDPPCRQQPIIVSPAEFERYEMWRLSVEHAAPFAIESLAYAIWRHEHRRFNLGRRKTRPTASEAWERALRTKGTHGK